MSIYLALVFQVVSLMFALSAVVTGVQSIVSPAAFSRFFGLPFTHTASPASSLTASYISLMGVRQLATGVTLLVFAWQAKWAEVATVLSIIGLLVAGTDGVYLARAGHTNLARFHAIPGACIAALAGAYLYTSGK